jgi:hypothetical protein
MLVYTQKISEKGPVDSSSDGCDSKADASLQPTDALNSSRKDIENPSNSSDSACGEESTGVSSDDYLDSMPGCRGIDPSLIRGSVQDVAHDNFSEQRSDIGDRSIDSVGYMYSESHAGGSVAMESLVDSVGRSDWSLIEGGGQINSGGSTADDFSFKAFWKKTRKSGGKTGPTCMLVRRNVELMGTIRALDEIEVYVGRNDENLEGSNAESSLGDGGSLLNNMKAHPFLSSDAERASTVSASGNKTGGAYFRKGSSVAVGGESGSNNNGSLRRMGSKGEDSVGHESTLSDDSLQREDSHLTSAAVDEMKTEMEGLEREFLSVQTPGWKVSLAQNCEGKK